MAASPRIGGTREETRAQIQEHIWVKFPAAVGTPENTTETAPLLGVFHPVASLVAQRVKCLPAMWETWVQSLGWEDPMEKEMADRKSVV